jgi:murein peptide amidase A
MNRRRNARPSTPALPPRPTAPLVRVPKPDGEQPAEDGSPATDGATLDSLAESSPHLWRRPLGEFRRDGRIWRLSSYLFLGPKRNDAPIRLGIFAGIGGRELESILCLAESARRFAEEPRLAADFSLYLYPNCNPTGLHEQRRDTSEGLRLERHIWTPRREGEAQILNREIRRRQFHGWIVLRSHDGEDVRLSSAGDSFSTALAGDLRPVLDRHLPVDHQPADIQDGFLSPAEEAGKPFAVRLSLPGGRPLEIQQAAVFESIVVLLALVRSGLQHPNPA